MAKKVALIPFHSITPGNVPAGGSLLQGEIAISPVDQRIWSSTDGTDVVLIGTTNSDDSLIEAGDADGATTKWDDGQQKYIKNNDFAFSASNHILQKIAPGREDDFQAADAIHMFGARTSVGELDVNNGSYFTNNLQYDGAWKPIVSGKGAQIALTNGTILAQVTSTGTAGVALSPITAWSADELTQIWTTSSTERMRLTSTGNFGVGTNVPVTKFVVSNDNNESLEVNPTAGSITLQAYDRTGGAYAPMILSGESVSFGSGVGASVSTTMSIGSGGTVHFKPGTNAIPAISAIGDAFSGINITTNNVSFSANGSQRAYVDTTALTSLQPVRAPSGSAAAPAYAFTANTDTGFYLSGSLLFVVIDGVKVAQFGAGGIACSQDVSAFQTI